MRRKLSEVDRGAAASGDESMFEGLWGLEALHSPRTPFKWEHLIALAIVFVSLVAGRWLYDGFFRLLRRDSTPPFQLANELTKRDNKALSISFAGFIAGLGLVTVGSLDGLKVQTDGLGKYILTFVVYQVVGILLMVVARIIIDKVVLRKVATAKGIIEEMNISIACVESAAVVGCAVIISTAAGGDNETNLGEDIAATLLYFAVGQVLLIAQLLLLDAASTICVRFNDHQVPLQQANSPSTSRRPSFTTQISAADIGDAPNVAAGLSFGLELFATALVIAIPIRVGYSLLATVIWVVVMLLVAMPGVHAFADRLVLRTANAAENVLVHQNWGASVLLGAVKVSFAMVANAVYQRNCSVAPDASPYDVCDQSDLPWSKSLGDRLVHVSIPAVFEFQTLVDLVVFFALVLCAKLMLWLRLTLRQGFGDAMGNLKSFSLDEYLVSSDNNAVAISLSGYILALAMTLTGVLDCPDANVGFHGLWVITFTALGMLLLLCAQQINARVMLRTIQNSQAMLDNNIAVACLEAGSFVACGRIMQAVLSGSSDTVEEAFATILLFWSTSQVILLLFTLVYRVVTSFDDEAAMKDGNVAVGLSSGLTLVAAAFAITGPIFTFASYPLFIIVSFVSLALLVLLRVIVDRTILPGDSLDGEMMQCNWGAALIEGAAALSIALVMGVFQHAPEDAVC